MPQVGVEATGSVALGAQGAMWVEAVVISTDHCYYYLTFII